MRRLLCLLAVITALPGCAGLKISTLKPDDVAAARKDGKALDGYIVYEPIVVFTVQTKAVAGVPNLVCEVSAPFVLPDYSKPYLIKSTNGLGKAGVNVTITQGWQLGAFIDNSDNTAILSAIQAAAGIKSPGFLPNDTTEKKPTDCLASGIYRVDTKTDGQPDVKLLKQFQKQ